MLKLGKTLDFFYIFVCITDQLNAFRQLVKIDGIFNTEFFLRS